MSGWRGGEGGAPHWFTVSCASGFRALNTPPVHCRSVAQEEGVTE